MLEKFQAQADEACRCSRRIGTQAGVKSCWAAFEKAVAPYRKSDMATACMPVSGEWVCFDEACEKTVQIDTSVSGWCTGEEREIASRTWGNAMGEPRIDAETEDGFDRGNAALKALKEKFKRGDKVRLPKSLGQAGC